VPFDATIPDSEQITDLGERLKAEASGILNWMLAGCAAWQADGLGEPDEVKQATAGYRVDMDTLGTFLKECCTIGQHFTCRASSMYAAYFEWTKATGEYAMNGRRFGMAMTERGFERFTSNGVIYRGIGLLSAEGTEGSE
jgi:putative DNA primase/helicase